MANETARRHTRLPLANPTGQADWLQRAQLCVHAGDPALHVEQRFVSIVVGFDAYNWVTEPFGTGGKRRPPRKPTLIN